MNGNKQDGCEFTDPYLYCFLEAAERFDSAGLEACADGEELRPPRIDTDGRGPKRTAD